MELAATASVGFCSAMTEPYVGSFPFPEEAVVVGAAAEKESLVNYINRGITRKYPLRRYILGVLTHTTALDQLWGGNETLK